MGLLDVASAYEKMLQDPSNRVSSQGKLKQPTPSLSEAQGAGGGAAPTPTIEDADDLWMKELDKRMAAKKSALINEATGNAGTNLLLTEMQEIKEMLKMVLDANLKLMEKMK